MGNGREVKKIMTEQWLVRMMVFIEILMVNGLLGVNRGNFESHPKI